MATFKELAVFFLDRRAQSSNWNRANPGLLPPNVEVSTQGRKVKVVALSSKAFDI